MKKNKMIALVLCTVSVGSTRAATMAFDTDQSSITDAVDSNSDGVADTGASSHIYSFAGLSAGGVTFDFSFEVTAGGGFLNGDNDSIGIWSNSIAEATNTAGQNQVNQSNEMLTFGNFTISNETGGSVNAMLERVGFSAALNGSDVGTLTIGGTVLVWDDLNDGDPFDEDVDLDGNGGDTYNISAAYADAGGVGNIDSFTAAATGGLWRVDALEFDFTAVPEPSTTVLLGMGGLALVCRRRKE